MSTTKPVLGYWDIRGFGQPIRTLLEYLQVDYEEKRYKYSENEWATVKTNLGLAFPNLPYLIDGEIRMTESRAIINHLVRKYDPSLFPQSPDETRRADMLHGVISDIWSLLVGITYYKSESTVDDYVRNTKPKLKQVAAFIGSPWCLGENLSYLDFILYEVLYQHLAEDSNVLDDVLSLKEFMARFEKIPAIIQFIKSSYYIAAPCYRPSPTTGIVN